MLSLNTVTVLATVLVSSFVIADPTTGTLGNATIVENNPPGVSYTATLPTQEFFNAQDPRGNIKGSITAVAATNGIGVNFKVHFENLPTSGGPFLYHIHDQPVPANGNCTSTLGHLDPFIRGETPACDATLPQTCQVGDLGGKHGQITSDPFDATYLDEFASTTEGIGAFFGNRSFVVHFGNVTRITCANFARVGSAASTSSGAATATSGGPLTQTSSPAQFTGGATASQAVGGGLMGLLGVMGIALAL